MKRSWFVMGLMVVLLAFSGCASDTHAESPGLATTTITNWEGAGEEMVIDKSAVLTAGKITAEQKQVMNRVESYVVCFSEAYNGHTCSLAGDIIEPLALVRELDARIAVLQQQGKADVTPCDGLYLTYEQLDVQGEWAKAIVSYAPRQEGTAWREGYLFQRDPDGRHWNLVNVIVDTGHGGDKVLDVMAASDDPQEWAGYTYDHLKRSDYENMPNFADYLDEDGEIDPALLDV